MSVIGKMKIFQNLSLLKLLSIMVLKLLLYIITIVIEIIISTGWHLKWEMRISTLNRIYLIVKT